MTSQKPRLHKPRNTLRSGAKPGATAARPEGAGSLDIAPAIEALELLLDLAHPADAQLSAFFRNYPNFGARERSFIAEAVYGVLRRLRSLQALAQPATPRRLLLAWLARHGGRNMREFEALESRRCWTSMIWNGCAA
jgi:16S rRNA (cytosine967-C5)-methyltransferase